MSFASLGNQYEVCAEGRTGPALKKCTRGVACGCDRGMRKPEKPSPTASDFRFASDAQPASETLTCWGGVPLRVRAFRSLGLPPSVERNVRVKQRQRGDDEATRVESFRILKAVGRECREDCERQREDAGLTAMIGPEIPSPEPARKFLDQFHAEGLIEQAQRQRPRLCFCSGTAAAVSRPTRCGP